MGNRYTEAQKKASIKYLKDNTDSIQIRTPKGTKDRWKDIAALHGKSLNQMIIEVMEAEIAKEVRERP